MSKCNICGWNEKATKNCSGYPSCHHGSRGSKGLGSTTLKFAKKLWPSYAENNALWNQSKMSASTDKNLLPKVWFNIPKKIPFDFCRGGVWRADLWLLIHRNLSSNLDHIIYKFVIAKVFLVGEVCLVAARNPFDDSIVRCFYAVIFYVRISRHREQHFTKAWPRFHESVTGISRERDRWGAAWIVNPGSLMAFWEPSGCPKEDYPCER